MWLKRLIPFVAVVGIAAATISVPGVATSHLDSSWKVVLETATVAGWQYGPEVTFTYGPTGYLTGRTYGGGPYWVHLVWQWGLGLGYGCLVFAWLMRMRSLVARGAFLAFAVLVPTSFEPYGAMLLTLAALLLNSDRREREPRWLRWLAAALLGVLATSKFTYAVLGVMVVGAAGVRQLVRRHLRTAGELGAAFLGAFVMAWVLAGQHLGNLVEYARLSAEISRGYQEAMAVQEPPDIFVLGLVGLLVMFAHWGSWGLRSRQFLTAGVALLVTVFAWKQGFVRADGHVRGFFSYCFIPLVVFPAFALAPGERRWERALRYALLLVLAGVGFVGLERMNERWAGYPKGTVQRWKDAVATVTRPRALAQSARSWWDSTGRSARLPAVQREVGTKPIDLLGYTQTLVIAQGLNYRPRPVFQGYSTYTAELIRRNEAYFTDPDTAPEYVLQSGGSIDDRWPTLDDSAVLRQLLTRYEPVLLEDSTSLLWRKATPLTQAPEPLLSRTVAFGERVDVPAPNGWLWLSIRYDFSALGRLRGRVYKSPWPELSVCTQQGRCKKFRLAREMAAYGLLLSPYVNNAEALARALSGPQPDQQVASFSVTVAPEWRDYFQDGVQVELQRLPVPRPLDLQRDAYFSATPVPPKSIETQIAPRAPEVEGRRVVLVHAPGVMRYDLGAGRWRISGLYGFAEDAYRDPGVTDGAEFRVMVVDTRGTKTVLHEDSLQPRSRKEHRRLQPFQVVVEVPAGEQVELQLITGAGPAGDSDWDWTVWSDVQLEQDVTAAQALPPLDATRGAASARRSPSGARMAHE